MADGTAPEIKVESADEASQSPTQPSTDLQNGIEGKAKSQTSSECEPLNLSIWDELIFASAPSTEYEISFKTYPQSIEQCQSDAQYRARKWNRSRPKRLTIY